MCMDMQMCLSCFVEFLGFYDFYFFIFFKIFTIAQWNENILSRLIPVNGYFFKHWTFLTLYMSYGHYGESLFSKST